MAAVEQKTRILVIVEGPPYGSESSYNALRLAGSLARREGVEVRIFLLGDAVGCAVGGQELPNGYYHLDRMLRAALRHGAEVGLCGTCMDARASRGTARRGRAPLLARGADRLDAVGRPARDPFSREGIDS